MSNLEATFAKVLLTKLSRHARPDQRYIPSTAVCLTELLKLALSLAMVVYERQRDDPNPSKACSDIGHHFFQAMADLLSADHRLALIRMLVPSALYAVQNNLSFVALSNLESGTYQVGQTS